MRPHARPIIAVIVFQLLLSGAALGDELTDRATIRKNAVELLANEQFSELEAIASRYRTSQSRTSSGLWHLTLFYSGISSAFDTRRKDWTFWADAQRGIKKWIAGYPNSPTAHLAYAHLLVNHGWSIRGTGYANSVKPEQWRSFNIYIKKARSYLEKHKAVASVDPYWFESMAIIARAQGWPTDKFSQLISEALEREPRFYQTYFVAMDYHTPKWGGSAQAIETFARRAMERTKDTEGFGMYARIYWYASQSQYGSKLFSHSLVHWPTMKKGIDDVLKRYPDKWNVNNFARFACLSKDQEKTAELLALVGNSPMSSDCRAARF